MDPYNIILEVLSKSTSVSFIIHKHNARNTSIHYDLRFLDPNDSKILHSFAAPNNFMDTIADKSVLVKTKDHDPRWLTLKSYRLENIDAGTVDINIATSKYFELVFKGKIINGKYQLFKMKTRRGDQWLLTPKR